MKAFLKENLNRILLLLLASLIFILWGRAIYREVRVNSYIKNLTTVQARIDCIASFGWEADIGSEIRDKVSIPAEFDDVYLNYNKIQKMCGFDLEAYKGKVVDKYTYRVLNFPYAVDEEVYVNILVYNDTMIAGDCMTVSLDGFMLPIDRRFQP